MICINILLNYAVGAVFGCLYWSAEAIRAVFSSWSVRYLTGRL
jgi:hypothetical protein